MSLVHCNSVYWTALTNVCHVQACKSQKRFSPELQWAKTTLRKQLTSRLKPCISCVPDDVQKATRLSFLTAILLMGLHSQNSLSVQTHTQQ